MGREGGVDGGDHVVLVLLVRETVMHAVRIGGLHRRHVCLHGEQRAVGSELRLVWNVHATKVPSAAAIVAIDDMTVGQDVCEGAFLAKLAVTLEYSQYTSSQSQQMQMSHLCEVLAGRTLRQRLVRMQERTGFSSLAGALSVELAGHVGGVWAGQQLWQQKLLGICVLLLLGGLRGPAKFMSRCPWPFPMRPPGTAMGPLPLGPAIVPLEGWCRKSREVRREIWGGGEVKAEAGGFSWCAKGACWRWGWWWLWWGVSGVASEAVVGEGAKVVMALARFGTAVQKAFEDCKSQSRWQREKAKTAPGLQVDITCLARMAEEALDSTRLHRMVAYGGQQASTLTSEAGTDFLARWRTRAGATVEARKEEPAGTI